MQNQSHSYQFKIRISKGLFDKAKHFCALRPGKEMMVAIDFAKKLF
jgi:hypothetical protein